jgi:hypothetical protein
MSASPRVAARTTRGKVTGGKGQLALGDGLFLEREQTYPAEAMADDAGQGGCLGRA